MTGSSTAATDAEQGDKGRPLSDWPLVSVVLPTRQRKELVRAAVAAVVAQTYPGPIECFVVHDQEPRAVDLEAMSRPGRTVTTIENDGPPGLAGARNVGLDQVSGEFVASCDDDDEWHPTKIEKQVLPIPLGPGAASSSARGSGCCCQAG